MAGFESRFERLELKYLIDEIAATRIRRDLSPYCEIDPHSQRVASGASTQIGYRISSLYLDTPSLAFHRAKERGDAERVKLRVRTYEGSGHATLEIKRRHADVIRKTRAQVARGELREAAAGSCPAADPESQRILREFGRVAASSGAAPTLTVRYRREAWISVVDPYARVTMDRGIRARRTPSWDLDPDERDWSAFDAHWRTDHRTDPVVLEIKCQTLVPGWIEELICRNELGRTSFSKYSIGINLTRQREGQLAGYSRSTKVLQ
jgi:hypothetical protein